MSSTKSEGTESSGLDKETRNTILIAVGGSAVIIIILALLIAFAFYIRRRNKKRKSSIENEGALRRNMFFGREVIPSNSARRVKKSVSNPSYDQDDINKEVWKDQNGGVDHQEMETLEGTTVIPAEEGPPASPTDISAAIDNIDEAIKGNETPRGNGNVSFSTNGDAVAEDNDEDVTANPIYAQVNKDKTTYEEVTLN